MYRGVATAIVCGLISLVARPAPSKGPQATDIFLAPLSIQDGRPVVGTPVNVTNRAAWRAGGYDDQPTFTPDGRAILFTSKRGDSPPHIYRYDIASKTTARLTTTPDGESSPAVMPGGTRVSVIRVERDVVRIGRRRIDPDMTQRLWSVALDGSDPRLLLASVKPIGDYAWLDAGDVAAFVLGIPSALVRADVRSGASDTLALEIARPIASLPDRGGLSSIRRADSTYMVSVMRWPRRVWRDLIAVPPGAHDVVWLSSDLALTFSNTRALYWRPGITTWIDIGDVAGGDVAYLHQPVVSPDGKWLAMVGFPVVCLTGARMIFKAFATTTTGFEVAESAHMPPSCLVPGGK